MGQGVADNMEEQLEWFCNLFVLHKLGSNLMNHLRDVMCGWFLCL